MSRALLSHLPMDRDSTPSPSTISLRTLELTAISTPPPPTEEMPSTAPSSANTGPPDWPLDTPALWATCVACSLPAATAAAASPPSSAMAASLADPTAATPESTPSPVRVPARALLDLRLSVHGAGYPSERTGVPGGIERSASSPASSTAGGAPPSHSASGVRGMPFVISCVRRTSATSSSEWTPTTTPSNMRLPTIASILLSLPRKHATCAAVAISPSSPMTVPVPRRADHGCAGSGPRWHTD
mmetsp:Transcript_11820/g.49798  ORF Transcript_11820/g.49798 Transcript_11820/m.49798 type:complete len:244 (+) Transcript_11820:107-838(+)